MADFPIPNYLQGTSLAPLIYNPNREWKTAAYSQFLLGRFGRTKTVDGEQMEYAIRTERYRYVEWYNWLKDEKRKGDSLHKELFDHTTDPQENINLANELEYKETVEVISQQLNKGWRYSTKINQ